MTSKRSPPRFAICLDNEGNEVDLDLCRVYRLLADARGEQVGLVRIIDESGEDYLYPRKSFVEIKLPAAALRRLARIERLRRDR